MFSVFFEILYERQLRKIDLNLLTSFIDLVKEEALSNGGEFFQLQNGFYFLFKKESAAYAFSTARFLYKLNKILLAYKNKIYEVRCITDYYEEEKSIEELQQLFLSYKKKLIPATGLFSLTEASIKLEKYIDFILMDSDIFLFDKFKFFENINYLDDKNDKKASIILHRNTNYFWALYNFMSANPLNETIIEKMSAKDKKTFLLTKNVYDYLKKYRFAKEMPNYFVDAFLDNAGIYLENYIKTQTDDNKIKVLIDNVDDKKNLEEAEKLYAANKNINIQALDASLPAIYNIPDDLLQLVYIILTSSKYFFYDEIEDFLLSLKKSKAFFDDIYSWMYSAGIIIVKNNIYAVPYGLSEIIERRISNAKNALDSYIAEFLWIKYKKGVLSANNESEKIFDLLNFNCNYDFKVSVIFHNYPDALIENLDLKKYKNDFFYDALKYYQSAISANIEGGASKSYALIKTAIGYFQEIKLEAGEYRAFSLLAFFNLSENKISDALTYFSYALDNAERSHDSSFICESLFNISIVYFLQNNLKQSMFFLNRLADELNNYFEQEWKIPYLFMKGRIYLQIGEFNKASSYFNSASEFASLYFEKLEPLCRVWYARSLIYMGEIKNSKDILLKYIEDTDDAVLFLLESFLLYPNLNNDFEKMNFDASFLYEDYINYNLSEFTNLKSGFSFAEDLIWSNIYNMSIGKKLFNAFYTYYNFKINFSKIYDKTKSSALLSELETSGIESLYQNDPYSSLYMYLCYEVSVVIYGENSSQTIAYLSKAFKSMQKNVLSIGENDVRDKYMQDNLWNSRLFEAAKNQKLI